MMGEKREQYDRREKRRKYAVLLTKGGVAVAGQ